MKRLKHLFLALVTAALASCACAPAYSQALVVATGGAGNTYSQMFKELMVQCGNTVTVVEKNTGGSNENVDLLVGNKVNGAFVQTDVMYYRARTEDLAGVKTLVALHPEEVHFVALTAVKHEGGVMGIGGKDIVINQVTDLAGKRVGAVGGSVVTAQLIRLQGEVNYTVQEFTSNKQAIAALTAGQLDAVVMVGGQPLGDVNNLGSGYKLLPVSEALMAKLKNVYVSAKLNYRGLGAAGVPTVATEALFVTRDYKSVKFVTGLKELRACFNQHLTDLQETTGTHPKWQDVKADNKGKWVYLDLK